MYFDIDILKNLGVNYAAAVESFIDIVNGDAETRFNLISSRQDVLVLDSSTDKKFSNHLIFQNIIFANISSCSNYVDHLLNFESISNLSSILSQSRRTTFFDRSVYSRYQSFCLAGSSKFGKNVALVPISTNLTMSMGYLFYKSLISDKDMVVNALFPFNRKQIGNVPPLSNIVVDQVSRFPTVLQLIKSLIGDGEVSRELYHENVCTRVRVYDLF